MPFRSYLTVSICYYSILYVGCQMNLCENAVPAPKEGIEKPDRASRYLFAGNILLSKETTLPCCVPYKIFDPGNRCGVRYGKDAVS